MAHSLFDLLLLPVTYSGKQLQDKLAAARSLLSEKNLAQTDSSGDTPLHLMAANPTWFDLLKEAIEKNKAPLTQFNHKRHTPLHLAILNRNDAAVTYLLSLFPETLHQFTDHRGNTLLHTAAEANNLHAAKCILERADGKALCEEHNEEGKTPYEIAYGCHYRELTDLLNPTCKNGNRP